jgi:glutathione S-transferase
MKLYIDPISTTSRPVMMLAAEANIEHEKVVIKLMEGEHHKEPFASLNPNRLVPVLQEGDFVLTESSAIMKYLADKADSPLYPKEPKARARVNERMDWFNTNFYREWGYNLIYPQIFPHHVRPGDVNQGVIAWGQEKSRVVLRLLNDHIIGDKPYVCGDALTIADIFGAQILSMAQVIGYDLGSYPKVAAWIDRLKERPSWAEVNATFDDMAGSFKERSFVTP